MDLVFHLCFTGGHLVDVVGNGLAHAAVHAQLGLTNGVLHGVSIGGAMPFLAECLNSSTGQPYNYIRFHSVFQYPFFNFSGQKPGQSVNILLKGATGHAAEQN